MSITEKESPQLDQPQTNEPAGMGNVKIADASFVGSKYSYYVLFVLLLVYIFNFVDRQILSILAEDLKADLGLSDQDLGVLYGTVFAVFYALFGIPLGRLADVWVRKSLISVGLFVWSLMTTLSGTAKGFTSLAMYRMGVGVGEASASPAAFSMLADYFPPKQRATAMAIYSSGVYIGGGVGIAIGGVVLEAWHHAFPDPSAAPLGLKGWQFAFMLVGIPGLLMALWVRTLREPLRGMSEGLTVKPEKAPFSIAWKEFLGIFPIVNVITLKQRGASNFMMMSNILSGIILAGVCYYFYQWLGSKIHWIAMAIGLHAALTWMQGLSLKSPEIFSVIFKSKTLILICIGFPSIGFVSYGGNYFALPFMLRKFDVSHAEIGTIIGLSAALAAWLGVSIGGVIADKLRQRWDHGRLIVAIISVFLTIPCALGIFFSDSMTKVYVWNFLIMFFSPMYIGPATSTVNDLVLPHMRATASAIYLMLMTFIGMAMGPYVMGTISALLTAGGQDGTTAIRDGILWGYTMLGVAIVCLLWACTTIRADHIRVKEIAEKYSKETA